MKIAVFSANLGGFDHDMAQVAQTIQHDYFMFTDKNFPPRHKAMTLRLQAKVPKFFGWQLAPGYDYYLWIDGNIVLAHEDSLKYFLDKCQDYDFVVLKHPKRNTAKWEARYIERGLKEQSLYLVGRYENELLKEQMEEMNANKDFVDDMLVVGGVFMYRNTPAVQKALKEWWYLTSRYSVMDQCSFAYVLKTSGVKVNVLPDVYNDCKYLSICGHTTHSS